MRDEFLNTSRRGYCEKTVVDERVARSMCTRRDKGAWPLTKHTAEEECKWRCLRCARCVAISVNAALRDCSWFARCTKRTRLKRDVTGFVTWHRKLDQPLPPVDFDPCDLGAPLHLALMHKFEDSVCPNFASTRNAYQAVAELRSLAKSRRSVSLAMPKLEDAELAGTLTRALTLAPILALALTLPLTLP